MNNLQLPSGYYFNPNFSGFITKDCSQIDMDKSLLIPKCYGYISDITISSTNLTDDLCKYASSCTIKTGTLTDIIIAFEPGMKIAAVSLPGNIYFVGNDDQDIVISLNGTTNEYNYYSSVTVKFKAHMKIN